MKWLSLLIALLVGFAATIVSSGCSTPLYRPPGAPVLLMNETPTKDPAIRQHGSWVQVRGVVTLHKGETVILLPATQP